MVGVWNTEQEGSCLQGCFSGGAHEQSFQAGVEPPPACENTHVKTHILLRWIPPSLPTRLQGCTSRTDTDFLD